MTNTGNNQAVITVNASNGIESFTASSGSAVARGTAAIAESGATVGTSADSRIYWTRWSGGRTTSADTGQVIDVPLNGGVHILHLPTASAIPTSGTAQYSLAGATSPTVADGSIAPGLFTGALGVDFKTSKVGIDFRVAIGGFSYDIATAGKATAPNNGGLDFVTFISGTGTVNGYGFIDRIAVATGGPACAGATTCNASLTGLASGAGATAFGVGYSIAPGRGDAVTGNKISGVAAFQTGGVTATPTPTPTGPTPVAAPPANSGSGTLAAAGTTYTGAFAEPYFSATQQGQVVTASVAYKPTLDAQGGMDALLFGGTSEKKGTLQNLEVYSNGGIAIGRWASGKGTGGIYPSDINASANQGLHYAWGSAIPVVPVAGGVATFALASATKPTFQDGSTAPGTLSSAGLSVAFGSAPHIGFEATIIMPETAGNQTYSFATPGGVAHPELNTFGSSIDGSGNFSTLFKASGTFKLCGVSGSGTTSCTGSLKGGFAKDLTGAAVIYDIGDRLDGAIAFYLASASNLATSVPAGTTSGSSAGSGLSDGVNAVTILGQDSANGVPVLLQFPQIALTYDATGALKTVGGTFANRTTATVADQAAGPGWEIGRWNGGAVETSQSGTALFLATQGAHYVALAKPVAPTAGGLFLYTLSAATTPTYSNGRATSAASFTGKLGIAVRGLSHLRRRGRA